ncbi:MAG: SRPBCC family protein [Polyangiales bacterium]
MRTPPLAALALSAALAGAPSTARAQVDPAPPQGIEIQLSDEAAEGTNVRRGVSRYLVAAPMADVVRAFTDYPHYTELLPHVTTSRVVRRTRAGTEVYLQVDLGGNLGALWSRVRVSVQRAPQRVTVTGAGLEGNLDRFEFAARIEPSPGDPAQTLVECRMLSIPQLPFPSTVFSRENRQALATMANTLRNRMAALSSAAAAPAAQPAPTPPPAAAPSPGITGATAQGEFPVAPSAPTSPSP